MYQAPALAGMTLLRKTRNKLYVLDLPLNGSPLKVAGLDEKGETDGVVMDAIHHFVYDMRLLCGPLGQQ